MNLFASKWFWFAALLVIFLLVLFAIGKKSVNAQIRIDAKPEQVWAVLTDTHAYRDWNPTFTLIDGEVREGNTVTYNFTQDEDNAYEIATQVKVVKPNQLLNQGGGMPGFLTFDHTYTLEEAYGGTLLTIHEEYRGIAVPFWNPGKVEGAYRRLGKAIKVRAEE